MSNSIEEKDWSESNESISRFMEKRKNQPQKLWTDKSMKDLLEKNNGAIVFN